jgi:hypothetical protein
MATGRQELVMQVSHKIFSPKWEAIKGKKSNHCFSLVSYEEISFNS